MTDFEKYKILKSQLNIQYKDIQLNQVLAVHIWQLAVFNKVNFPWKSIFFLFLAYKFDNQFDKTIFSTFGRYYRKDHFQLYRNIIEKINKQTRWIDLRETSYKVSFHPILIINLYKKYRKKIISTNIRYFDKIKLFILIIFYCNNIEELEKKDFSKVTKYLSMCSCLDMENLISQFLKKQGVQTFTLQEGIYLYYKINPPLDCIVYENLGADYLLCWSKYTIDQLTEYGITQSRLLEAGYPKSNMMKKLNKKDSYEKGIVLLARENFKQTNISLINLLIKYSPDFSWGLKLHPSCDFNFYNNLIKNTDIYILDKNITIQDCLEKNEFDFSIAVNTSAYYDSLIWGVPSLRFYDNKFDLMFGGNDIFLDENTLREKLEFIKTEAYNDLYIKDILKYAIGLGIDNYNEILLRN